MVIPNKRRATPRGVIFQYSGSGKNIAILDPLVGRSGWLLCSSFTVNALETEDHLVLAGIADGGEVLDALQCRRLFDLPGEQCADVEAPANIAALLDVARVQQQQALLEGMATRNGRWFDIEMDKLDRWARIGTRR